MKNQAIQYLALDVHQATVVASLRDESGKVVMRAAVPTEIKAILTLVNSAGPRVYVAFEEGTQAQWLHDGLIDHAERVLVCNVGGRSETTNRTMVDTPRGVIAGALEIVSPGINGRIEDESAGYDCSAHTRVLTIGAFRSVGAACKGEDRKAISEGEKRP